MFSTNIKCAKTIIAALGLAFLVIITSCKIEPRGNENTETKTETDAPPPAKTFDGDFYYSGKLNDKDILVKIVVKDKTLSGGYYYVADGKEHKVAGKLTSDTTGEMTEFGDNNQPAASFNGTFKPDGTAEISRTATGESAPAIFTISPLKDEGAYKPN